MWYCCKHVLVSTHQANALGGANKMNEFLSFLGKAVTIFVLVAVGFAAYHYITKDSGGSSISPLGYNLAGQWSGNNVGNQTKSSSDMVVCNFWCGKEIIHSPRMSRSECNQKLASEGQKMCDAYSQGWRPKGR